MVIVTGPPRTGKTTLVLNLVDLLRSEGVEVAGMVTKEVSAGGERIGFDIIDLSTGRSLPLARKGQVGLMRLGSYAVFVENLNELGVSAIEGHIGSGAVMIVDEVGPMELMSSRFVRAVEKLVASDDDAVLTVHYRAKHDLIEGVKSISTRTVLTPCKNREEVTLELARTLAHRVKQRRSSL